MPRWSESLIKTRVAPDVFAVPPGCTADERRRIDDLRFLTEGVFDTAERLKAVRDRVQRSLARGPETALVRRIAEALGSELDEIGRDLEFARSRRGRFVLFANDWAQGVHARLRADPRLDGVSGGSNPDREAIVVAGTVAAPEHLVRLVQLLATDPPGVPLEYRVVVQP